ncbi:type II secretion system protein F [bacterium BMS3Abin05]|nr:type II secretion system protein F [bacterium BMS3Abin05]GBE28572.1 type II secretion system protein F [bacterium BMS3Bbin03]HDL78608.1 type II secretion system F family protein [Bacteroidota bacterium]HDZ12584.1 type II secretion system F family protein [Bacteroidota bacterium]
MEKYKFRARDAIGKVHRGIITAENLDEAVHTLKEQNYYPVVVAKQKKAQPGLASRDVFTGISSKEIMLFCGQLATLLNAGVSIVAGLFTIKKQMKNPRFQKIAADLEDSVSKGHAFSVGLAKYPRVFPSLLVYMVKAGEESGQLDKVLQNYTEFMEKKEAVKSEIKNAMMYPIFLVILSVGIMVFLLVYVLPKFITILRDSHAKLPLPTRMMIQASEFLQHYYIHLFLGTIVFLLIFRQLIKTRKGREIWDQTKLKLPVLGNLTFKMALVHFTSVFGVLISSGVPILRALEMGQNVVNNVIFTNKLKQVSRNLTLGKSLGDEIAKTEFFPPLFVQMVSVGEETGRLDKMMEQVTEFYNKETNDTLKRLVASLEPVMLVVMALLVGFIAVSLVSALMSVLNTIK